MRVSLTEDVVLELRLKVRRKLFSYSATWEHPEQKPRFNRQHLMMLREILRNQRKRKFCQGSKITEVENPQ